MTLVDPAVPRASAVSDRALRTEIVRAGDPAWDAALDGVASDVFHRAGYHAVAADAGEGEPYLVVVRAGDRGFAWPYLLRPVPDGVEGVPGGAFDVTSVYGYPGPVAWGCGPGDPFLEQAWSEVRSAWRDQGVVSAFTRFHPLLDNAALVAGASGAGDLDVDPSAPGVGEPGATGVTLNGQTVSVDLTLDDAAVRASYGRDLRREIDVARRKGLVTTIDDGWTALPAFAELYRATMVRTGATSYYFFDEAHFRRLRDRLPGHVHLVVTRLDEDVAAAGLFTEWDGIAQWYLVGSNDAHRSLSPSKVLLEDALRWARDRGNRVMHLGGGRGGQDDALFWFKSRFSPRRHPFHTGRWIVDPTTYRELTDAHRAALGGEALDPGYFPVYRAPVASPVTRS